jgi:tetratricopeptide (TPR) repeat protein
MAYRRARSSSERGREPLEAFVMQSDGVLRHLVFFEELGRMEEMDAGWRAVSAGLVVMRLVDRWIADGPAVSGVDSWSISAVREAIAHVAETTPVRRILTSIVDVMVAAPAVDLHALSPRLMAYGQALEYEARWALAGDVYTTIITHSHPVEDADLATAANLQLAFCLRTLGELDGAASAYEQASRIAYAANDLIGVLRGRLGDAKIATARGNMPHAEAILAETIERADEHGLADLKSNALIDRAYIAGLALQWDRTIGYSYQALEVVQSPRQRDRILNNIATAFRHLGLSAPARDAYLVLAATGQEQYLRWLAEVNLMELAALERMELQFDRYRRDLESADFTPQLRITYLISVGRGYHALGHSHTAVPYLERAVEMASDFGFNQMLFEAEATLADARKEKAPAAPAPTPWIAPDVRVVADAIHEMRETAGIG